MENIISGSRNLIIGKHAGENFSGSDSILIGKGAGKDKKGDFLFVLKFQGGMIEGIMTEEEQKVIRGFFSRVLHL